MDRDENSQTDDARKARKLTPEAKRALEEAAARRRANAAGRKLL